VAERVHRRPTRCSRPGLCAYRPVFHTIIVPRDNRWRIVTRTETGARIEARAQPRLREVRKKEPFPPFFLSSPLVASNLKSVRTSSRVLCHGLVTVAIPAVSARFDDECQRKRDLSAKTNTSQRTMTATQLILVWIRRLRHVALFFTDRLAIVAPTTSAHTVGAFRTTTA